MNPQIIMKESKKSKVDPKIPSSHPNYQKAVRAAEIGKQTMTFESEGERLDYERAVKSNPNNIPGLAPFFPPERIQPSHGFGDGEMSRELPCGHKETKIAVRKNVLVRICRHGHEYVNGQLINDNNTN